MTMLYIKYTSFVSCCCREDFFIYFHYKSMVDNDMLPQNMKALGLVVLEKKIFLCFSHDNPRVGPVWTPGARLAGFIKRTTIHCYTQNVKALGLVVSEKKIFLFYSHCKSMGANDPRSGAIFDPRGMIGRIYKEDHYTLLHTKYESFGSCGFGEEDFFMFFP